MNKKTNIIFDLNGVLFKENKLSILRKSGILKLILYLITHKKNPVKIGFDVLHRMHLQKDKKKNTSKYRTYEMPQCMSQWMKGVISNKYLLKKIKQFIQELHKLNYFASEFEKNFVYESMKIILDEKQITTNTKPIKPMIELVKTFGKEKKYNLFIISNYAKEAAQLLIQKYKAFFSLFDDIIISANIGMIKPDKEIYEHFLNKHSLYPEQCLFIDDQEENIVSAQNIGIKSILYNEYKDFEIKLKELKILK